MSWRSWNIISIIILISTFLCLLVSNFRLSRDICANEEIISELNDRSYQLLSYCEELASIGMTPLSNRLDDMGIRSSIIMVIPNNPCLVCLQEQLDLFANFSDEFVGTCFVFTPIERFRDIKSSFLHNNVVVKTLDASILHGLGDFEGVIYIVKEDVGISDFFVANKYYPDLSLQFFDKYRNSLK